MGLHLVKVQFHGAPLRRGGAKTRIGCRRGSFDGINVAPSHARRSTMIIRSLLLRHGMMISGWTYGSSNTNQVNRPPCVAQVVHPQRHSSPTNSHNLLTSITRTTAGTAQRATLSGIRQTANTNSRSEPSSRARLRLLPSSESAYETRRLVYNTALPTT